ncbi:MAG: aldo/keto reductase [Candidatus Obscuribacter sp.]|nr:aldo/keto reductase [Candidatus Obscuribacter sp.]MBK9278425.1 aldo/keto reductase [Candidatus Obscuribacter sp.]MBL8082782.1 aldo/keto reductase [Candidatus Obscuribacter sp.]
MKKCLLSKSTGLTVSRLGLGCMGMSWAYGSPDRAESIKTLQRALALGIDFLDTAEIYGPYTNEELLGEALAGRREEVILATKFGFNIEAGVINGANSHPKHIRRVLDESLKRLRTDYVDLYYQHRVDPKIPIEEVVGTVGELVEKGKVRHVGLSEANSDTIKRAHATFPIAVLQSEYSLWERGVEADILPTLRKLGIGFVPYSPLGRGFLTGAIKKFEDIPESDYRRTDPRYQGSNFAANLKLVAVIEEIAKRNGATPAQVALSWVLAQGEDMVPIPGTKRVKFLEENVEALNLHLSASDMEELNGLSQSTAGPRYDERRMSMIQR